MKAQKFGVFLVIMLPLAVCAQNRELHEKLFIQQLTGKWDWQSTYGGFWGKTYTPESEGYTSSLILFQDSLDRASDSISYLTYINDSLIASGRRYISPSKFSSDSTWKINPYNIHREPFFSYDFYIVFESAELMKLYDGMMDGFTHTYERDLNYHVYIPDDQFLDALIDNGVDDGEDGLISYAEARATTILDVTGLSISEMTGIEAFSNLKTLYCADNQLSSLDLTHNHKLQSLDCARNNLESVILSIFVFPSYLDCSDNQLITLDLRTHPVYTETGVYEIYLKNMPVLKDVYICDQPLTDTQLLIDTTNSPGINFITKCQNKIIDIPDQNFLNALLDERVDLNNDGLVSEFEASVKYGLSVSDNDITDMTGLEAFYNLTYLGCVRNQLTNLNVSSCTSLVRLYCRDNQITKLDISRCTSLMRLYCQDNQLTSLDVSDNTNLIRLFCDNNLLTNLDISGCTSLERLTLRYMPSLYEVCVWTTPFPPDALTVRLSGSPNVYFTTECTTGISEAEYNDLSLNPNPSRDFLTVQMSEIGNYTIEIRTLNGQLIFDSVMEGHTHLIDLSSLQKGIYFITVRSRDFVRTEKIIKL